MCIKVLKVCREEVWCSEFLPPWSGLSRAPAVSTTQETANLTQRFYLRVVGEVGLPAGPHRPSVLAWLQTGAPMSEYGGPAVFL